MKPAKNSDAPAPARKPELPTTGILLAILVLLAGPVGMTALGLLNPDYTTAYSNLSHLGEEGGAVSELASSLFIAIGCIEIAIAVLLAYRYKGDTGILTVAALIAISALFDEIGSGIFPIEPTGAQRTLNGFIHRGATLVGEAGIIVAPLVWLNTARRRCSCTKSAAYAAVTAAAISCGFLLYTVFRHTAHPIGIYQRIAYFSWYLWLAFITVFPSIPAPPREQVRRI